MLKKNNEMKLSNYKSPKKFYFLSTIIPWTLWFIAGYISHKTPEIKHQTAIVSVLGLMGLITPMIVAVLLIRRETNFKTDFTDRFFNFNLTNSRYLLLSIFIMPSSILLAQLISLFFGYDKNQFQITGHYTFTSGIFPVWFLLIIAPIVEELGWHSYGTEVLRNKFNLLKTSLIFALYWGVWHIPLSTIKNYYQSNLILTGLTYSINFLVSIFPFVIIMNWLYYKTDRNILIAIFMHIGAGFFNEIFATHPDSKIIQTILLTIFAVIIIFKEKTIFFERQIEMEK
jgi:uncharacterized protein